MQGGQEGCRMSEYNERTAHWLDGCLASPLREHWHTWRERGGCSPRMTSLLHPHLPGCKLVLGMLTLQQCWYLYINDYLKFNSLIISWVKPCDVCETWLWTAAWAACWVATAPSRVCCCWEGAVDGRTVVVDSWDIRGLATLYWTPPAATAAAAEPSWPAAALLREGIG